MYRVAIDDERDVYMASSIGKKVAEEFGLDKIQQTKLVVSIMELARNIIYYAAKGEIFIIPVPNNGIEIVAIDQGPGIKEIEKVLKSEIRSKKGLGLGLSGVQRLMDEFEITSKENIGTIIRAVKWLNERQGNHH